MAATLAAPYMGDGHSNERRNMNKRIDLASLLPMAGMLLTALGYLLEAQQRRQDNHEIALEVARILKDGE